MMRISVPPRPDTHYIVCFKNTLIRIKCFKETFTSCSAFSFREFIWKLVPCERGRDSERPLAKLQPRPRDDIITAG